MELSTLSTAQSNTVRRIVGYGTWAVGVAYGVIGTAVSRGAVHVSVPNLGALPLIF